MTTERGTQTPRTDALANRKPFDIGLHDYTLQMVEHARQLERELATERTANDLIAQERDAFQKALDESRAECAAERKAREAAEKWVQLLGENRDSWLKKHDALLKILEEDRQHWNDTVKDYCEAEQRAERAEAVANGLRSQEPIALYRGLLLWALWHHQGGSSAVGQPIRRALGIGEYDHLSLQQIADAKDAAALAIESVAAPQEAKPLAIGEEAATSEQPAAAADHDEQALRIASAIDFANDTREYTLEFARRLRAEWSKAHDEALREGLEIAAKMCNEIAENTKPSTTTQTFWEASGAYACEVMLRAEIKRRQASAVTGIAQNLEK